MQQDEINKLLINTFDAHNIDSIQSDEWILPNGKLPAICCSWYPNPSKNTGQLDVHVLLNNDKIIIESFVGIGEGSNGYKDGFHNFMVNSLHVLLAAFWNSIYEDQVLIEEWEINSIKYTAFIGNFGIRNSGNKNVNVPGDAFNIIEKVIKNEKLSNDIHWIRTFFCNGGHDQKIFEALLDNEIWQNGEDALKTIDWEKSNEYYSIRNFIVLRRLR